MAKFVSIDDYIAQSEEFAKPILAHIRKMLLQAVAAAMDCFEKFSQSHKNEYIEWITQAKTEATRQRRIAQMIDLLLEGKNRNWKYQRP